MLVQVVDIFDHPALERAAHRDVVEQGKVLDVFTQADAAGMRTDRDARLGSQEEHRDRLVDPAQAAGVELPDGHRPGLQELLDHDPVVGVLTGGHPDPEGLEGPEDPGMTEDVVRAGRLLDEARSREGEVGHPIDRLVDVPDLVGVHHQDPVGSDLLADDGQAPDVVRTVATHLELELGPARGHAFPTQAADLRIVIAEPAG